MPGYFIYCRKSSEAEDRQILSIESQTRELEDLAKKLNSPVIEILTEAKSAKEPGRSVFNRMMQRLNRNEAAGVICWKLDRLARNPIDGGSIIWAIKKRGIKVITPAQSYTREDDNIILMYIEFGMAQKYVDDLSKNVKLGLKTKVENGWYPVLAPLGYLNNTNKLTGENTVVKDAERFPLVRRMWDLMLTGLYTPPQILDMANNKWGFRTRQMRKKGGKPLARSAMYDIFTKSFYYGWFEFPMGSGQHYRGKHEMMVTEAEYDRVQILLGRDGNPRPSVHFTFPFTGLIRCGECGLAVTAEEKRQVICGTCKFKFAYRARDACPHCKTLILKMEKPLFLHYTYYHCCKHRHPRCTQKCVSSVDLHKQIDGFLARIQISERFKDWAVKYLHELHEKETASRNDTIETQQKAYRECIRRIDNLIKLKTSADNCDGSLLSNQEYGEQRFALLKEKANLEELLRDSGHRVEQWLKLSKKTFTLACTARQRFANGDSQTKKEILLAVGSNLTLKDKKLFIEATKPFFILENSLNPPQSESEGIEPEKTVILQGQTVPLASLRPLVWALPDDVRTYGAQMQAMVASVYVFFKKECVSPSFTLSTWSFLNHEDSMDDVGIE